MEVTDREQVLELSLGPECLIEAATARAVPIPAGVAGEVGVSAAVADSDVSTEAAGAASQDVGRCAALFGTEVQPGHVIS